MKLSAEGSKHLHTTVYVFSAQWNKEVLNMLSMLNKLQVHKYKSIDF